MHTHTLHQAAREAAGREIKPKKCRCIVRARIFLHFSPIASCVWEINFSVRLCMRERKLIYIAVLGALRSAGRSIPAWLISARPARVIRFAPPSCLLFNQIYRSRQLWGWPHARAQWHSGKAPVNFVKLKRRRCSFPLICHHAPQY